MADIGIRLLEFGARLCGYDFSVEFRAAAGKKADRDGSCVGEIIRHLSTINQIKQLVSERSPEARRFGRIFSFFRFSHRTHRIPERIWERKRLRRRNRFQHEAAAGRDKYYLYIRRGAIKEERSREAGNDEEEGGISD